MMLSPSSVVMRFSCGVGAATLTRPFGAASPVEGEVRCELPPLRLSPGGRSRARSARVRWETLRFPKSLSSHDAFSVIPAKANPALS
jgi:hypothetical protein